MAKCDLTISIEGDETRWQPGDSVRGVVVVESDSDFRCDDLSIRCGWRTHGKGNRAEAWKEPISLFQGQLTAGLPGSFPFEIQIPTDGPVSYEGHYLNVGWLLQARADIPWKLDPSAEFELQVVPQEGVEFDWRHQFDGAERQPEELRSEEAPQVDTQGAESTESIGKKLVGWFFGLGCLAALAGLLYFVWSFVRGTFEILWHSFGALRRAIEGEQSWIDTLPSLFPLLILLLILGAIGYAIGRVTLRKKRLGEVVFTVEPQVARAGQEVRVTLHGQTHRSLTLNRATLFFEAEERVVRGSGTNKKTFRHGLHEESSEIATSHPLSARIPYQVSGVLLVPDSAPPSFAASDNVLEWKIKVEMDVARCPDWSGERILVVAPS